ncbi:MAG: homoserine O-acetyltransferase/O-succinyltransferase [Gammaproteobacteria bacterium]|nr:homoserine O-acetyltransferase/O-succinyltransferase [Gammaproteobacteria bacterium]
MKFATALRSACFSALVALLPSLASAQDYPTPREGDWIAPSFTFHTGETLNNVRLHYVTVGDPTKPAILVLHGTNEPAAGMLTPHFAGKLFGPGQPLDATKYFIILPEGIGIGKSTKPSDGLRARFPQYDYNDMVSAQYRMVTEGLGIHHLRLVLGYTLGGMQTWLWGEQYPDMMDALVPMAAQPTEMSSRNWMMRRMLVESIKQDPAWDHGNYSVQPPSLRLAGTMFAIATSGGTLAYQALAPTNAKADKMVDNMLAAPKGDANDVIYQWASAADYNAEPGLNLIRAPLLAINSADDERNPPETGTMQASLKQLKRARLLLIPASAETRGHGTELNATFYAQQLGVFMQETAQH